MQAGPTRLARGGRGQVRPHGARRRRARTRRQRLQRPLAALDGGQEADLLRRGRQQRRRLLRPSVLQRGQAVRDAHLQRTKHQCMAWLDSPPGACMSSERVCGREVRCVSAACVHMSMVIAACKWAVLQQACCLPVSILDATYTWTLVTCQLHVCGCCQAAADPADLPGSYIHAENVTCTSRSFIFITAVLLGLLLAPLHPSNMIESHKA